MGTRLDGKVAVVTGAARGIGRGHALLLAEQGASVVVNDLGGECDGSGADQRPAQLVVDEIVAAGGKAVANYDDVSDWEGGQRMINRAVETFGGLDILICNAGILRDRMTFNMTEEEWDAVIKSTSRATSSPCGGPRPTGGSATRRRASRSTAASSSPRRSRGCSPTPGSSTTTPPSPGSRRWPSSWPRSSPATATP